MRQVALVEKTLKRRGRMVEHSDEARDSSRGHAA
jgi:hypothetical protein